MNASTPMMTSLGFADGEVPVGTHICQIFTDDDERDDALLSFLLSGLRSRERAACFSEKTDEKKLDACFSRTACPVPNCADRGR